MCVKLPQSITCGDSSKFPLDDPGLGCDTIVFLTRSSPSSISAYVSCAGVGNPPFVATPMEMPLSTATNPADSLSSKSAQLPVRPPGTMATEPGSVSSISATRTTAMEPGGLAWNVNQSITLDNPSDSRRNLQSSHPTTPFTYANVTVVTFLLDIPYCRTETIRDGKGFTLNIYT